MSGGKGGGSTSEVTIPEYIERAAQRNLNKAEGISQIGYTPYYGPDVAAFTPMQQAAFQNTADASSAFGMAAPTSQQDIMGGMGAPTTYAGGVQGYSSAPMFEQSLAELGRQRPGQKDYIDSFFIDPFTGQAGSRVSAPVNYENYMTAAESGRREADANRANELAIANAAYKGPSSVFYNNEDTVMNTTGIGGGASASGGSSASFDSPSDTGSYGGSLMTGGPTEATGNVSVYDPGMTITNPISGNTSTGGYVFNPEDYNTDYGSGPAPTGSTTPSASDGGFISIGDMFDGGGAGKSGDTFEGGGIISDVGNAVTGSNDDDDNNDSGGGGGSGCVVATHAVESGAFTPNMKREAVVWCMNALHGKWWGEAVRRGYRHLGKKKIEQGKAREHYQEFRRYIAFASGKKRDVRGAITFALRTAQFFAVGLIKKDA